MNKFLEVKELDIITGNPNFKNNEKLTGNLIELLINTNI